MFDWDDQELSNIIWDEADETDDHIVPYPKGEEEIASGLYVDHVKQGYNEEVANFKPTEEKKPANRGDLTGVKRERPPQDDTIEGTSAVGYGTDSWPDLSSSHGVKTVQNPLEVEVSGVAEENSLKDGPAFSSDEVSQLDNGSEIFLNQQEDKEQIGFLDYGWASIGSFDDLDRIFSNDDPIFGSLGNADQIWSSSKDITSVPDKTLPVPSSSSSLASHGAIENTSELPVLKTETVQDLDLSYAQPCGEMIFLTSQDQENQCAIDGQIDRAGGNCQPVAKEKKDLDLLGSHLPAETIASLDEYTDKVREEKKIFRSQKKMERGLDAERPLLQDSYSSWYDGNQVQQFGQIVPSVPHTTSALKQQAQLQGPWSAHYQQPSSSIMSHDVYETFTTESTPNSFRKTHSIEENKSVNPPTMTPQEKIEKLRRRQQMQALLAIQKQQKQLSHQVSCNDQSAAQNFLNENQVREEPVSSTPLTAPNSSGEQYDSNTISAAVNDYHSMEEIILHQLQGVVAQLDTKIRLCIRDSLFRLARSAMQRQYAGDTSTSNLRKDETVSDNRCLEKPDVETETNPIDRTVAHLLFHRPLDSSEIHVQTPESPAASMKLESTTRNVLSSPERGKPQQPCHGSIRPLLPAGRELSRSSKFEGPSENVPKDGEGDAAGELNNNVHGNLD